MLNGDVKNEAIAAMKDAAAKRDDEAMRVFVASEKLFNLRKSCSEKVIGRVEEYINTLTSAPKKFDKNFIEFRAEFSVFNGIMTTIEEEASKANVQAGAVATAGVAAGVGVATLGPTAAMAIATTFGTASSGVSISALSGVAATKAALAWLGGGALAAGGGGMAAGEALLALAGPVGWAIGGAAVVAAGLIARGRNQAISEEAVADTETIQTEISSLTAFKIQINRLISLTERNIDGVTVLLAQLQERAPDNYLEFSKVQKEWLNSLISHVDSLSELLNKNVQ
tara:strand:+ start:2929 stop:3777 length:849 start_codon:yes stop_codon:yes gene_type:complete